MEKDRYYKKEKDKYFKIEEAKKFVGKRIRSLIEFSGVPKGTTGKIVEVDSSYTPKGTASLVIEWELGDRPYGIARKPLRDWFTKEEVEKFLEILG